MSSKKKYDKDIDYNKTFLFHPSLKSVIGWPSGLMVKAPDFGPEQPVAVLWRLGVRIFPGSSLFIVFSCTTTLVVL